MNDIFYPVAHRTQEEIDSAKDRYIQFDTSNIKKIFKKALNIKVIGWTKPTSWSTTHVIYFVTSESHKKPFVLRANTGKTIPELYLKVEQLVTAQVSKLDIPVNKILYVDVSRKEFLFDFQIQQMLEGKDIEDHFKGTQEEYDKLSFELGTYVAKMSTLTYSGFGRFDQNKALKETLTGTKKSMYDYIVTCLDEDIRFLADQKFITKTIGETIRKLFDEYRNVINITKGSLVQYDLADHNMFFKNNQITGIYDWEACVSGDPVLDLASAPTWKTHYPREKKLIEGFISVKKLPEFFKEKMNIYRLRTMLWKAVFALRSGIMDDQRKTRFNQALQPFHIV